MNERSTIGYIEEDNVELASKGIYFAKGGAIELLTLPLITNPLENDWQEENGLEIDPKGFVRTCPYINLRFIVTGRNRVELENALGLLRKYLSRWWCNISPKGMCTYYQIKDISFEGYKDVGSPLYLKGFKCGEVSVRCKLGEARPSRGDNLGDYAPPTSPLTRIMIGDTDLAYYGIQVTGAYDSLLVPTSLKEQTLMGKPREIAIDCISMADDFVKLEYHLYLLWENIAKKQFYLTHGAGKVRCYYTSMTNLRELPTTQKKGIAFTLNFRTT